jgi:hypothetical protein
MTDHQRGTDLHPTDEPDGTTALQASLRPPGESVTTAGAEGIDSAGELGHTDSAGDTGRDEFDAADDGADESRTEVDGAGYDADAVSGDTGAYRPQ